MSRAPTLLVVLVLLACSDPASNAGSESADPNQPYPNIEEIIAARPKWGEAGRFDPASLPDRYENSALGIRIAKPREWVWLPETSMPDYATREPGSLLKAYEPGDWGAPNDTPLIAMASVANQQRNRDVEIRLMVKPQTDHSMHQFSYVRGGPKGFLNATAYPGILRSKGRKVVEEAEAHQVSGLEGAVMRFDWIARCSRWGGAFQ